MIKMLKDIYHCAIIGKWNGNLIDCESGKIHETVRNSISTLATIVCAPNASKEHKQWAKDKIEELLS